MQCVWIQRHMDPVDAYTSDDLQEWIAFYEAHRCPHMCETGTVCDEHMKYWPNVENPDLRAMFRSLISMDSTPQENFNVFFQSLATNCSKDCMALFEKCIWLMFSPFGLYAVRPHTFAMMIPTMIFFWMQYEAYPGEPFTAENIFKELSPDFDYDPLVDIATNTIAQIQNISERTERLALYQMLRWRWNMAFANPRVLPAFEPKWIQSWQMQTIYPPKMPFQDEFLESFTRLSVDMCIFSKREERIDTSRLHDLFLQVQENPQFQNLLSAVSQDQKVSFDEPFRAQTPMIETLDDMETDQSQTENPSDPSIDVMDISAARAYASRKQKDNPSTGCHVM